MATTTISGLLMMRPWWVANDLHQHRWQLDWSFDKATEWSQKSQVREDGAPSLYVMGEERIMKNSKGFEPLPAYLLRVSLWCFFCLVFLFANVTQWGLVISYVVAEWARLYEFSFDVQSKWENDSRIGLRGVLNGTVEWCVPKHSQYGLVSAQVTNLVKKSR